MYFTVHHTITDAKKWDQVTKGVKAMTEQGRLPQGLKGLMYLPSTDGRRADCVWEANTLDSLKGFLDRETGMAAKNEYVPINADAAFGLPGHEMAHQVA